MFARNGPVFPKLFWLLAALPLPLLLDAQTSVTLSSTPNPSIFGTPVTLTAPATYIGSTGHVTFFDGVNIVGSKPVTSGAASFSTTLLSAGSHKLTAYYRDDVNGGRARAVCARAAQQHGLPESRRSAGIWTLGCIALPGL